MKEFMFDKDIALDSLLNIESALNLIIERAAVANTPDDFLCSPNAIKFIQIASK